MMERERMRRVLAEKAMGWRPVIPFGRLCYDDSKTGRTMCLARDWHPDRNWRQCGMVIEMMREKGWNFQARQEENERGWAVFWNDEKGDGHGHANDIKLAVCAAAFRALIGQPEPIKPRPRWIDVYPKTMLL